MYLPVIMIGWLYVTLLMAITEPNVVAGVMSFVFYGLVPVGVLLSIFRPRRRRGSPPQAESVLKDSG